MGIRVGWRAFAEWALGVALLSFAVVGAASIGVSQRRPLNFPTNG
jgi:hypothetical protein